MLHHEIRCDKGGPLICNKKRKCSVRCLDVKSKGKRTGDFYKILCKYGARPGLRVSVSRVVIIRQTRVEKLLQNPPTPASRNSGVLRCLR